MVTEPLYNYQFNLNTLRKAGNDDWSVEVTSGSDNYIYLLNVCDRLNSGKEECADSKVGACQTKPSDTSFKPVNAGKFLYN